MQREAFSCTLQMCAVRRGRGRALSPRSAAMYSGKEKVTAYPADPKRVHIYLFVHVYLFIHAGYPRTDAKVNRLPTRAKEKENHYDAFEQSSIRITHARRNVQLEFFPADDTYVEAIHSELLILLYFLQILCVLIFFFFFSTTS